jgi:prepilin signal peptidase PulO-like enzyme (type II secretory pathway)
MSVLFVTTILGILGLFFGSFAGATVWRLRAAQLREDESAGEKIPEHDKKAVKMLKKSRLHKDRSVCLQCGHTLAWYDLIPLVSWVSLRGKCRYCHKYIGGFEPVIELGVAVFFAASFFFWPYDLVSGLDIARFVLWLVAGVGVAILAVYDAKWFLLPNKVVFPLIGIGVLYSAVVLAQQNFALDQWFNIFFSCLVLSGLYYLIYVASRHQWVGFGDIKLGLALALLLADWRLAILALFMANAIGTLLVLPMMLGGRIKRQAHIPFGPLLISGWVLAGLFGDYIVNWYLLLVLGSY